MMTWLKRILGGHRGKTLEPPAPLDEAALQIRKEIEDNLEVLHFLATCGPFNKEKLQTYLAMCSRLGKPYDFKAILQMENSGQMVGGFERLRSEALFPTHAEAWRTFFDLLAKMRPSAETAQFLKGALKRFDEIGTKIGASS